MTWKEFAELSKSVFVEMATAEFGIKGRPTNVSRVSILTGISRKEVKRQRDLLVGLDVQTAGPGKTTDATRLLSGWHQDPDYLDHAGKPLDLNETGPSPSFDSLCQRYGGDIPKVAMLKELIKTKVVERTSGGQLRALSRYYMPAPMKPEYVSLVFGQSLHDLASTIDNNIGGDKKAALRFQGYADDRSIDPRYIAEFHSMLESEGQKFLETVDAWLSSHRLAETETDSVPVRLGVGMYAIKGPDGMKN